MGESSSYSLLSTLRKPPRTKDTCKVHTSVNMYCSGSAGYYYSAFNSRTVQSSVPKTASSSATRLSSNVNTVDHARSPSRLLAGLLSRQAGHRDTAKVEEPPSPSVCSSPKSALDLHSVIAADQGEKVLFLDVDGVLHSYFAKRESELFRRDCMQRLKKIVNETGCKIVLSSSWRATPERKATVNRHLQSYGIAPVHDCTRIRGNEYLRHEDVLFWVKQNPQVGDRWIAIDDLPMPQLGQHYVQTEPDEGLVDHNVKHAIRILNAQTSCDYANCTILVDTLC